MLQREHAFGVWLQNTYAGALRQRGDHVRFALHPSYTDDPLRPVLGLVFEQDLARVHAASLRLPPWFANLLPEGVQRRWIAQQRGVSDQREMELLAEVGRDLPGAVTVLPLPPDTVPGPQHDPPLPEPVISQDQPSDPRGRFSLAGVQLKLSMVAAGDRLVLPLGGALGDWIVKFPDAALPHLPVVEFVTMELARAAGIDVPPTRLVPRAELPDTPDSLWTTSEDVAFAVRRFDRGPDRSLIHMEDLAQVRNVWPDQKYQGRYEAVAAVVHRGHDLASLEELVRRVAFNVLVDNSDAHLKNFSLLYADPRRPRISPAYDLVSVAPYPEFRGGLALGLGGTRRTDRVRWSDIGRLGSRLGVDAAGLIAAGQETVRAALNAWPGIADAHLGSHPTVRTAVRDVIAERARSLAS